jgi:ABC-type glycerol-3-phosphate transport system substrate-binding protein
LVSSARRIHPRTEEELMKHLPSTTGRIFAILLASGLALAACSGPKAPADQTAAAPASTSQADSSATTDTAKSPDAGTKHKAHRHRSAARKTAAAK